MKGKKKRVYGLADFFGGYMDELGQLTLSNLMFSVPAVIFIGAFLLINMYVSQSIFVLLLIIPLLSPFTAGLFYIAKRLTLGEEIKAWRDLRYGIKSSWKPFLINGLIAYPVISGIVLTFSLYRGGLSNPVIIAAFISSLVFVIFYICFENSFLTMLVTIDITPGQAVKNAVLLFIGGFGGHLKIILSYMLISALLFSAVMLTGDMLVCLITIAVPLILLMPMLCSYIVVYNTFVTLEKKVVISEKPEKESTEKKPAKQPDTVFDTEELEKLSQGDPEEFVFIGGRMLKRKKIKEMLK